MARARLTVAHPGTNVDTADMTARRSGRPDPEGHHDDLSAEDLDGLSLLVPDDPRALTADREAWLRETAGQQPAEEHRSPRHLGFAGGRTSRRRRLTLTAGLVVCSMLVVALSGVVGAFVMPQPTPAPPAAPLASVAPVPGQIGGLLPVALLTDVGTSVASRSLRPAVIALLPKGCSDCPELVREVRRQAAEFGLPVTLVGGPDETAQLSDVEQSLGAFRLDVLTDPAGTFATTYGAALPTLVMVRADGTVVDIVKDPPADLRLEATLIGLSGDWDA